MGDGMTRLFHIILSLVNAKNGYLLIDEVENGLHWSIHAGLWNIVFTMAGRLNVQVFATTHNRDCVRGFHEAWSPREAEGTFQRIDVLPGTKIMVNGYTCETLADALETDVEVR
jgi:ABC-type multidrug transport system ATPase subunit